MKLLLFRALCEITLFTILNRIFNKFGRIWNSKNSSWGSKYKKSLSFFSFYFTFKIDIWKEKSNQGSGRGTRIVIGHLHGWSVATDSSPFVCVDEKFIPSLWIQIELLRFKGGTGIADGIHRTNLWQFLSTLILNYFHSKQLFAKFARRMEKCFDDSSERYIWKKKYLRTNRINKSVSVFGCK